jgi:hypothetical protein
VNTSFPRFDLELPESSHGIDVHHCESLSFFAFLLGVVNELVENLIHCHYP